MSLPTIRYRQLLDAAAVQVDLPQWVYRGRSYTGGEWLEGLVMAESGGNPRSRRYEPHQDRINRKDAPNDPDTADVDDGEVEDDASYGLMQVMGYNVRALVGVPIGTAMRFGWLFLPIANVAMGLRVLTAELKAVASEIAMAKVPAYQHVERALARYNGGPTGDDPVNGDYRLRAYVDRIASHATAVQRDRGRLS